jgi:glycosyltransferase involved in cell wall biosynthesis
MLSEMSQRVLITTTAYPPSTGGVQAHIKDLRERLTRYQADVAALWLAYRTDWLSGTTLRLSETGRQQAGPGLWTLGWSFRARARMLPWTLLYYAIPPTAASRIASEMIPFLDKIISPDHMLIHSHRIGREFFAQASLGVARKHHIPFVLTPHHHPKWRGYRYAGWLNVYRAADAVLTHTETELRELERLGVKSERLTVMGGAAEEPIPADPSRFRARIAAPTNPIVLFIGQLYEYKGIADLIAAAEALNSRGIFLELVLIGPETPFSRALFRGRRIPWLHLLGRVDTQTKWDALEAATLLCLPSRHEAFGRVYLEAWSKHKPVIGGRIPAVSEIITDGETGLLVDPGSPEQIARAIERLITDPVLANRMAARGAMEVEGRFSWRQVVNRVEAAYDAVLGRSTMASTP